MFFIVWAYPSKLGLTENRSLLPISSVSIALRLLEHLVILHPSRATLHPVTNNSRVKILGSQDTATFVLPCILKGHFAIEKVAAVINQLSNAFWQVENNVQLLTFQHIPNNWWSGVLTGEFQLINSGFNKAYWISRVLQLSLSSFASLFTQHFLYSNLH